MRLLIDSLPSEGERTLSALYVDGIWECHVLEDRVREIPGEPVGAWKIPGRTAIPEGIYRVTLEYSPRFGPDTITINDVPGFTAIRIHAGNDEDDTEGCPLVGDEIENGLIKGGTSRPTLARLRDKVKRAIAAGDGVEIEVIRNFDTEQA